MGIGPRVEGFSVGDRVFAMADNTYAELCVINAVVLAKVPAGLDLIRAAALPLVTVTGHQLSSATEIKAGQTILVAGAAGGVGRSAAFTAKERGAVVIAGVLRSQIDEAKTVAADEVVATDDDTAIANLAPLDAIADTVGGKTAEKLIARVKPGGVFATVLGAPENAARYPSVKVVAVFSKFDRKTLESMAEAVRDGKLVIPISFQELCHSVKQPRLRRWQKRAASGRSCWWFEPVAQHSTSKGKAENEEESPGD